MERRIGRCRSDVIYDTILFILLSLVFLVVAYPLYFVIISSVSDPIAVSNGEVTFYPIGFTLDGYREVFKTNTVVRGFLNSLLYTVCGVSVNLLVTLPTGYALSRKDFALKKFVTFFYMLTMFIGGGMMPTPNQNRLGLNRSLSVMVFFGSSKLKTLAIFPSIFKGEHINHRHNIKVLCGHEITVRFDRPAPLQIDGETVLNVSSYRVKA